MKDTSLDAVRFYDSLASIYDTELASRAPWVGRVEGLIARWAAAQNARSILDVGAGNGRRLERITKATGMRGVATDISPGMMDYARGLGLEAQVADMSSPSFGNEWLAERRFDIVICTWNVLGHVMGHEHRLQAVRNMRRVLAPGGSVILDVNNRHNAAQYGWRAVTRNLLLDTFRPGTAGDFLAQRANPEGQVMKTWVHVFSLDEVRALCAAADLQLVDVHFLDYATGQPRTRWSGQMCVRAQAA